ncbi:hypothetical protein SmJEL517_g00936 [Synchytrium microbalum]|uniref:Uncharacterized protein n=1 Tax=Synchytrium microbalum TaxID=1806994 RepID=A0A507C649_9FUNG|nr:uncharacterized protein SmJEL517_g00936 [Synchytrium microbalum]TPX37070.1 hypothetical protein SmJEL517_g00936 [Synchytrium microbalum]
MTSQQAMQPTKPEPSRTWFQYLGITRPTTPIIVNQQVKPEKSELPNFSPPSRAEVAEVLSPVASYPNVTTTAEDGFAPYNKYIVGGASLTAFCTMLYTVRMQTKGKMRMPLQELLDNPIAAAANPKLAAYAFAGRAFATASVLVGSGTLAFTMGLASLMGVNSLKEFSTKLRSLATENLPVLRGSTHEAESSGDSVMDKDTYEFLKEVQDDMRNDRINPQPETLSKRVITHDLRESFGVGNPKTAKPTM